METSPDNISPPIAPSRSWQGHLHLEFVRHDQETRLNYAHGQAPLKIQRPFYPEGTDLCHGVMLHTAGGVVGGDRLQIKLALQAQAQVLMTTAAAAKIYRSNGEEAQQTTQITVGPEATLEWFPGETIVFDGAIYRQNLRIDLEEGALWLGWEITRLGRSARGEQFLTGTWRSHTEIWQHNRPLWIDRQWLVGGSDMLTSPHGLAECPVVGSFAVVGRSIPVELVENARLLEWGDRSTAGTGQPAADVGVTRLQVGLLCRYRGYSTTEARRWFTKVWALLRPELLNRPICKPRVWP